MMITTQIQTSDANYPYDPVQAAAQVLTALGGDPANDTSVATVTRVATLITTNVELGIGDSMPYTTEQMATRVLAALNGHAAKDTCVVMMLMPMVSGQAGVPAS